MPDATIAGDSREPELIDLTEAEFASMRRAEGAKVIEHDGRFWEMPFPGFWQPVHWLARFPAASVRRRPTLLSWGYRVALTDEDAHLANGSIPLHLLAIAQYTERGLDESRRRDLRRCRREVELRRLREPSLLINEGFDVFMSAKRRVPHGMDLDQEQYRSRVEERVSDPRRLFVAGLVDGRLAGYMESYAVDGALYTHEMYVATEHVRTGIGTGLYIEAFEIAQRTGTIREICNGIHAPERQGITTYKNTLGSTVVQIPARVVMAGPTGAVIKARRPLTHYRLTGIDQAAATVIAP